MMVGLIAAPAAITLAARARNNGMQNMLLTKLDFGRCKSAATGGGAAFHETFQCKWNILSEAAAAALPEVQAEHSFLKHVPHKSLIVIA